MAKTKVTGEYLKDSVVRFTAKAGENITKGNAVYISGISGEVPVVSLADANDANKMPCFGLAEATVSTNAEVDVISYGSLKGLNTSSFSLGDILFIGTTAGALTNDPAGLEATKLQNIGIVQRVHASNGSIKVGGAGRTNAVPNLDNGDIFIGNSDNKAVSSALSTEIESYLDGGTSTPTFASAIVSGDLTVDTSTLKVDSTNNRVGIGTDSPSEKLEVAGNIFVNTSGNPNLTVKTSGAGNNPYIRIQADTNYWDLQTLFSNANDELDFRYNGSSKMIIDNSGNVGIGVASPSARLELDNPSLFTNMIEYGNVTWNQNTGHGLVAVNRGSDGYVQLQITSGVDDADVFTIRNSGTGANVQHNFLSNGDAYHAGNVGIGLTSPEAKLHVDDNTVIFGSGASGYATVNFHSATTGSARYASIRKNYDSPFDMRIRANNSTGGVPLIFEGGNDTEYARFDNSGNLLVGATSLRTGLAEAHYFVGSSSNSGSAPFTVYNDSGTANCPALNVMNRDESVDSSNRFIQFWANVTSNTAQAMGGIVGNSATNAQFATLSDEREKENITPVTGILDKVMNLNVVSFDWKFNDEHVKAGFIAQNVEEHFPEYVIENVSLEGEEPRKGTTGGMSAGYIAVLTKAIQEQQEQIESLKSEIELLKGN
jgi:hypothetical protein